MELTDAEIERENKFLAGVPFFNWGAFFMPPVWGIAHGDWPTILFYPLWVFCDNLIYSAWANPRAVSITLAVLVTLIMLLVMLVYARLSSPRSAHRADEKGITRERYLQVERRWAVAMFVLAVIVVGLATWYNLAIRPTL